MYNNFKKDEKMVSHYLEMRKIDRKNIVYSKYELYNKENMKEYLESLFQKAAKSAPVVITESIVYEEDAYLNTSLSELNKNHMRIYTINEILDITKEYAELHYFLQFKEEIEINNLPENLEKDKFILSLNNLPENIKDKLDFKYENNQLKTISINCGIFIFSKN